MWKELMGSGTGLLAFSPCCVLQISMTDSDAVKGWSGQGED